MTRPRDVATTLLLSLALCSCDAGRPPGMPVPDGPGGGLRPIPDPPPGAWDAQPAPRGLGANVVLERAPSVGGDLPPGSPAPELPTWALVAVGIVASSALVRFRRERRAVEAGEPS